MVDHLGEVLDGDELLYIIAREHLTHNRLKGGVVGTVMSNMGLEQALRSLGIEFVRTNVGDRYVLEQLQKQKWTLGGEGSGHIITLDINTTGDGVIAALQVLFAMVSGNNTLHELKAPIKKYPQIMRNVKIKKGSADILSDPKITAAVNAAITELDQKGRVLLRPSGTEPLIRVMVEGEDKSQVMRIADELADVVTKVAG
jgi:phosphoglucosamine mutase